MSGTLIELEVAGGLPTLRCPVTGTPVWTEDGFDENAAQSPYLRFFIDWIGTTWVVPPSFLTGEEAAKQRALIATLQSAEEDGELSQDQFMKQVTENLPRSAIVFEVLDPPRGGGFDGEICYVGFDFAESMSSSQDSVTLRLLDADELT